MAILLTIPPTGADDNLPTHMSVNGG